VARHDRLGDLVVTLPAIAALREAYPSANLALLVRPDTAPFARLVAGVDVVLGVPDDRRSLVTALREHRPDLMVCISRGAAVAWAAGRSGALHTVGAGHRYFSWLFERRVDERRRAGERHEV
jgi:ADP-heptose:LPS heptosyltransferase